MALGFVRLYYCHRYVLNTMDIVLGSNFWSIPLRLDSFQVSDSAMVSPSSLRPTATKSQTQTQTPNAIPCPS